MRNGTAMAWVLAFCVTGCGKGADPAPAASEPAVAVASETPAAETRSTEGAAPAVSAAVPPETTKAPVVVPAVPARLRALGTEPFWNVQIGGGTLTYTTPEDQKGRRASVVRRDQANGAEFSGQLGQAAVHLAVTKRTCSDGMSDRSYPFAVVLTLNGDRRAGCAS
jgi:uncharacterized membrane protein